jgi:signal recognition particle GTPase
VQESEVRELLTQYGKLKKLTKMFKGRGQKSMMDMLKKFGKFSF